MPSPLAERRSSAAVVVPLSPDERRRLDAWALEQEREVSQAIRFLLRDVLTNETPATAAKQTAGARATDEAFGES